MVESYSRTLNRVYLWEWTEQAWGVFGTDIPLRHVTGVTSDRSIIRSGSKNPLWKWQVAHGSEATSSYTVTASEIPDTYYTADLRTWVNNPLQWHIYQGWGRFVWSTGGLNFPSAPAALITRVTNRCIQRFIERCNSVRTSFEAGQDIGELKETVESIIHPMNSLKELTLNYITKAKRIAKGRHRGPSIAKALADTYLEYRFGWRPLAMDVADGISSIHQRQMFDTQRISASASDTDSASFGTLQRNVSNGALFVNYKSHVEYGVRYIGGIRTGQVGGFRPLAQELQLDLPHFIPTVWDLIPYSWIVDYFTNIGDFLQGLCFRFSDVAWGCVCTYTKSTIDLYGMTASPAAGHTVTSQSYTGGPYTLRKNTFTRTPMHPGNLVPTLTFEFPLSSRPWENLGALLTSRLA